MSDDKICADASQPATLHYGAKSIDCLTLQEAVLEWMRLSKQDRAQATIRASGGTVYKANEIDRLHVGTGRGESVAFPCVSELRNLSIGLDSPKAYFRANDDKLSDPKKRKFFLALERELQGLDAKAWEILKSEALPLTKARDQERGWQQLFDRLNEAKGYNYLVSIGCKKVEFIPRAKTAEAETPDLQGVLGAAKVLCEVKTINVSDGEASRRDTGGVGHTLLFLEKEFFENKLSKVINKASSQLLAFDNCSATRRIVYVVFNFDDSLHECAEEYQRQIEDYLGRLRNIEVVLDVKAAFHSVV
jgi:hypothetical protein